MIDLNLIEKGVDYKKLNISFIIFICTFDIFKKGRHIYTFRNVCQEEPDIVLEDGATRIFLNARGILDDVDDDIKDFLHYLVGEPMDNR